MAQPPAQTYGTEQPLTGIGAKFKRFNTTNGHWELIGEITQIKGPTMKLKTIDVTTLGSLGGYNQFIAGLRDPGTITLNLNFARSSFALMKADFESGLIQSYLILLPDANQTTLIFNGFVEELPLTVPIDKQITVDVSIKISGQVQLETGSDSMLY